MARLSEALTWLCEEPDHSLKALSFFDDVPKLPAAVKERLGARVRAVDLTKLPTLPAYTSRGDR